MIDRSGIRPFSMRIIGQGEQGRENKISTSAFAVWKVARGRSLGFARQGVEVSKRRAPPANRSISRRLSGVGFWRPGRAPQIV